VISLVFHFLEIIKKLTTFSRDKSRKFNKIIDIAKEYMADELKTDLFILLIFIIQIASKLPI
jgi:hypothetical protein